MWGIWDCDSNHWVRELPSKVNDGGIALLAFWSKREACRRAAKHFGFGSYTDARRNGCCDVRRLDAQPAAATDGPAAE